MEKPKYSITCPVYNQLRYTVEFVESLKKCSDWNSLELIITDGGSTDGTAGYLSDLQKNNSNVKIITMPKMSGFTLCANAALRAASGEYIVIINNDVVLSEGWLESMSEALETAADKLHIGKIGFVGPVSGNVAGIQKQNQEYNLFQFDDFSKKWREANHGKYEQAAFLSGFAIMMTREALDNVGVFDERFGKNGKSGFEDNELILRGFFKGYNAIIDYGTFIHHYGSMTSDLPEMRFVERGLANRQEYYSWWEEQRKKPQKLVVGYRIKNVDRWIKDSLRKTLTFADEIRILIDGAHDKTLKIVKKFADKYKNIKYVYYDRLFNEFRDRTELLQMMQDSGCQWMLCLDGDEIMEDRFNRSVVEKLMHPPEPSSLAYIFKFNTFWRGRDMIRADGTFGRMANVRMGRLVPNQRLYAGSSSGLHCSTLPRYPRDGITSTSYRIKHYGFENYELCQKKYKWITEKDTEKNPLLIGGEDYFHLIDESNLNLRPYNKDTSIGLATIMKNEGKLADEFFKPLWAFFDEIVIGIDDRTSDNTEEICQRWGAKTFKFKYDDSLAKARNEVLKKVKTKFVFHLDADEKVPDLFHFVRLFEMNYDGYFTPISNIHKNGKIAKTHGIRVFKNLPWVYYEPRVHETLETAFRENKGKVMRVPHQIIHLGYLRTNSYLDEKLDHYEKLNNMMIEENPNDPRSYFNLSLHYLNIGDVNKAEEYMKKSASLDPTFFLPRKELALLDLRKARFYAKEALKAMPEESSLADFLRKIVEFIDQSVGEPLKVGAQSKDISYKDI